MKALWSALGVVAVLAAALGAGDAHAIYNRATFDRLASGTAHKPSVTCSKLRQRHKPLPARCRKKAPPVPPPEPTPPAAPLTRAGTVAATIPIESPTFLRQLNGSLWVGSLRGTLTRVDPQTNAVTATVPIDCGVQETEGTAALAECRYLAFGAGRIWVSDFDKALIYLVDPDAAKTNTVVANVGLPRGASAYDLAVGFGSVWAVTNKGLLFRIDPATNTATGELMLTGAEGDTPVGGGATVAFGSVWASTNGGNTLLRITPGQ